MTEEEIRAITGKKNRNAQCRVLRELGYKFLTRPNGSPVVLKTAMPRASVGACGALLTEQQIIKRAKPIEQTCAIYFLIHGGVVVYVGKSINLHKRIGEHLADPSKTFDAYHHFKVSAPKAAYVEEAYIKALRPKFNVQLNTSEATHLDGNQ